MNPNPDFIPTGDQYPEPHMSKPDDPFDSREFYELMQAYRWERREGTHVVEAFEAVKEFARQVVVAAQ